jgi:spore germination cell wall hydrolase CwlJ-like protein
LVGASVGLGLGAIYLVGGLNQAVADHVRTARIAQQADGGLSETMLQREMNRLDPAALMLARAHDAMTAADPALELAQAWPGRFGVRFPSGRHASALENARDLDCLTEAVYFEARGEPARGQAAVAQVVLNRVANPSFPKTVCGVVFQGAASRGCQFSFACDGSMRQGLEAAAWDRARRVAERALAGVSGGGIGNATHFHTVDVQPYWTPQMLRVAQVGLHIFYRVNPHASANPPEVERAVMTSLPTSPVNNLRLASAILEKAADVTAANLPKGDPVPAKSAVAPAVAAEQPGASTAADSAAF